MSEDTVTARTVGKECKVVSGMMNVTMDVNTIAEHELETGKY